MIRMKAVQWANNWSNNFYIELATSTWLLLNKNESIYLCYIEIGWIFNFENDNSDELSQLDDVFN